MTSIITRAGKGSALTHIEMDANLDSFSGINEPQTGTSYTVAAADQNRTIEISNASAVAVTLTLISTILTASDTSDFKVIIKNIGAGLVTITPTTDTFDDGSATKLLNQYEWIQIQTDNAGTSWNVISEGPTRRIYSGTFTTASLTTGASEKATITHGLGSDDLDFSGTILGSLSLAAGSMAIVGVISGVDKRALFLGNYTNAPPTVLTSPSTGDIEILLVNRSGTTQAVTINYTLTRRD